MSSEYYASLSLWLITKGPKGMSEQMKISKARLKRMAPEIKP